MIDYKGHPYQYWGHTTYAQHGEDHFLFGLFAMMGIRNPSYLDVGAHHPLNLSNTALFYLKGCRGVNVEANPKAIAAFLEHRPQDTTVNIGVAPQRGTFTFHIDGNPEGVHSFIPEVAQYRTSSIQVETITLNDVVDKYCSGVFPDFLSIDIEGFDHQVLDAVNFSFSRPKVICCEARVPEEIGKLKEVLCNRGYFCLCFCMHNLVFVLNEYESKVR